MDGLLLARSQFAITTVYHFFFVPLTLGLSILVAIMETLYVRTGDERYKRMTQFWGKLFLINFAMGVVTGIVQEFQFGLNWSNYSRFVGDIFGAPLAIEALLAFFLESTFLGVWIFGWDRFSKRLHAATIWLVAIGSNLSAFWILVANSFMQEPVGYVIRNGRAEMTDFFALITNPHVLLQFPHVVFAGVCTAGFFVLGISAYHLLRRSGDRDFFTSSFKIAAIYGLVGSLLVIPVGHAQAQHAVATQPMKMAAAEALWNSEDPAALSLFTWGDETNRKDVFAIRISRLAESPGLRQALRPGRGDQGASDAVRSSNTGPATTCPQWPSPTGASASWWARASSCCCWPRTRRTWRSSGRPCRSRGSCSCWWRPSPCPTWPTPPAGC